MMQKLQTHILDCTTCLDKNADHTIDDQLILKINDIDDLAIAWITNDVKNDAFIRIEEDKNGTIIPLDQTQWLWRDGGQHGNGEANITQWLLNHPDKYQLDKNNTLYLVVAIYDFKYNHPIFKGGKWSFDAALVKNGQSIWHNHNFHKSDTKNDIYGLQYLKILQLKIKDTKINISETIPKDIAKNIFETITTKYNYKKSTELVKSEVHNEFEEPRYNIPSSYIKKSFLDKIFSTAYNYMFDILFIIVSIILSYSFYNHAWVTDRLLWIFILFNFLSLLYFFVRFEIGGMAWALVLRKKHNKELDTFMVTLGLLFTAAFGAITSFDFDAGKIQNSLIYIIEIFTLYISTNIVLLYILIVISTYSINTLNTNKKLVVFLISLIGLGIFIQEYINFEQSYKENISKVEICGAFNATKK